MCGARLYCVFVFVAGGMPCASVTEWAPVYVDLVARRVSKQIEMCERFGIGGRGVCVGAGGVFVRLATYHPMPYVPYRLACHTIP